MCAIELGSGRGLNPPPPRRGAARARARGRWAALLALACVGCSGEAFRLAALELGPDAGDDDRFDDTVAQDDLDDDERPEGSPASPTEDAGADAAASNAPPDSSPEPDPPGACGVLRSNDSALANGEVCIEAGSFTMGSAAASLGVGYVGHGPAHTVTLSAYVLDAYEVSVARFRACVQAGACPAPSTTLSQGCTYTTASAGQELYPVTCVSWQQASDFCVWDGGRRLPTEAEWERAARGTSSTNYPWGDTFDCTRAVLAGPTQCSMHAGVSPRPAGLAPAGVSAEGAYDLIGNAAEWVADWFGAYSSSTVTDPAGPATGSTRIQRGGNWQTRSVDAVGYARRAETPGAVGSFSFRCARTAP
jgi:sulfatase modifying factor 1